MNRVAAEARTGREAVDLWCAYPPDLTLLDLRVPLLDCVDAIREIRRAQPQARLIVLTTFDTDSDLARAIRAGARG